MILERMKETGNNLVTLRFYTIKELETLLQVIFNESVEMGFTGNMVIADTVTKIIESSLDDIVIVYSPEEGEYLALSEEVYHQCKSNSKKRIIYLYNHEYPELSIPRLNKVISLSKIRGYLNSSKVGESKLVLSTSTISVEEIEIMDKEEKCEKTFTVESGKEYYEYGQLVLPIMGEDPVVVQGVAHICGNNRLAVDSYVKLVAEVFEFSDIRGDVEVFTGIRNLKDVCLSNTSQVESVILRIIREVNRREKYIGSRGFIGLSSDEKELLAPKLFIFHRCFDLEDIESQNTIRILNKKLRNMGVSVLVVSEHVGEGLLAKEILVIDNHSEPYLISEKDVTNTRVKNKVDLPVTCKEDLPF